MKILTLLLRVFAVLFAMGMLAAFVWYSQISAQTTLVTSADRSAALMPGSKVMVIQEPPRRPTAPRLDVSASMGLAAMHDGSLVLPIAGSRTSDMELTLLYAQEPDLNWQQKEVPGKPEAPALSQIKGRVDSSLSFAIMDPNGLMDDPSWAATEEKWESERAQWVLMIGSKSGPVFSTAGKEHGGWKKWGARNVIAAAFHRLFSPASSGVTRKETIGGVALDRRWSPSVNELIAESVLKSSSATAGEPWSRDVAKPDFVTWAEWLEGTAQLANDATVTDTALDLETSTDLSTVLAEREPVEVNHSLMLMSGSKAGPVFAALRPFLPAKKKPTQVHASSQESIVLKEAVRHLFSSESATTTRP